MRTHYESHGQWVENEPYSKDGRWNINYSDILTQLIHSCGKYCQSHADDLFMDWYEIEKELEKGEPINAKYIFAIRTYGVDHDNYYEIRKDEEPYHEVWELTIRSTDNDKWLEMEMNLIAN